MDQKYRRLHPSIIIFGIIRKLVAIVILSIIYLLLHQNYMSSLSSIAKTILAISIVFSLMRSYLFWKNFTYIFEDDLLIINSGMLFKSSRVIALHQIRNIDLRVSLLQRLFGVVELRMDAEGGEKESLLKFAAVTRNEVERIKSLLRYQEKENSIVWKQFLTPIFVYGITTLKVGYVSSFLMFCYFQFDFLDNSSFVLQVEEWLRTFDMPQRIGAIAAIFMLVSWMISVFFALFRFYRLRVYITGDSLQIKKGLVNTHTTTIKMKDLAAIRVEENILRQLFGLCTVYLDSISGGNEDESNSTILIPLIRKKILSRTLQTYFPTWDFTLISPIGNPADKNLFRSPKRSMLSFCILKCMLLGGCGLLTIQLPIPPSYVSLMLLLSVSISLIWGSLQYKDVVINTFQRNQLSFSTRFINKTTVFMGRHCIQQMVYRQNFIQSHNHLCTIMFTVRTSAFKTRYKVKHIDEKNASIINAWFSPAKMTDL
ncbi:PH domain-containing protein [Paenibacillus montanisoli]|uniref:PH domain-containing protein n=1 Tax=Paenibacillus montanisoli TaxID=2081970 RepID=UPI0014022693|nr:PH domain-containing protein [Paenibacillus montanisoli]